MVEQYVGADLKEEVYEKAKRQVELSEIEGRDEKAAKKPRLRTVRRKPGIVKGSSKVTNPANKCAKNFVCSNILLEKMFEGE